jgi:hypothetical protein
MPTSVDQPKQLACLAKTDRWWLQLLLVIKQVLVAGDDCLSAGLPGQCEQVIILRVSQGRLDNGEVDERDGNLIDALDGLGASSALNRSRK